MTSVPARWCGVLRARLGRWRALWRDDRRSIAEDIPGRGARRHNLAGRLTEFHLVGVTPGLKIQDHLDGRLGSVPERA
jgi:hypothetical protein